MAAPAGFAPFSDPALQRKQEVAVRASFKAFNAVANALLTELTRLYPNDVVLLTISKEFAKAVGTTRSGATAHASKPPGPASHSGNYRVPASAFLREIRKEAVGPDGKPCEYVDLLITHNELAFKDPIPVTILRGINLSAKWSDMPDALKAGIWEYLDRLIALSTRAMFGSSAGIAEKNALSRAIVNAAAQGKTSLEALSSDPLVSDAAAGLVKTLDV